jgi:hypothetical protein
LVNDFADPSERFSSVPSELAADGNDARVEQADCVSDGETQDPPGPAH